MRNDLVEENINLVHLMVHRFGNLSKETYEDYFQEGCYYLILAAERFDESKGFAFSTFACNYIYNGIRRYKRDNNLDSGGIRISGYKQDILAKARSLAINNDMDLENAEDYRLICEEIGVANLPQVSVASLDINIVDDSSKEVPMYEVIPSKNEDFNTMIEEHYIKEYLKYIKPKFSEKAYSILSFITQEYISKGESYTQHELSEKLGLSQAQVSRTLSKGLKYWKEFSEEK